MSSTVTRTGYEFLVIHTEWSSDGSGLHYFAGLLGNGLVVHAYRHGFDRSAPRWVSVDILEPQTAIDSHGTISSTGTDREGWSGSYGYVATNRDRQSRGGQAHANAVAWAHLETALPGFLDASHQPMLAHAGERVLPASVFLDLFAIQMTPTS